VEVDGVERPVLHNAFLAIGSRGTASCRVLTKTVGGTCLRSRPMNPAGRRNPFDHVPCGSSDAGPVNALVSVRTGTGACPRSPARCAGSVGLVARDSRRVQRNRRCERRSGTHP
jgi:hypothetical protein